MSPGNITLATTNEVERLRKKSKKRLTHSDRDDIIANVRQNMIFEN